MGNLVCLNIENLKKTENAAAEILRHIAAIRELQTSMLGCERINAELKVRIVDETE